MFQSPQLFSPQISTYSLLTSYHEACQIVSELIRTSNVEFQLQPFDDSKNPFNIIYSRLKGLKNKILKMTKILQDKYGEDTRILTQQQSKETITKMKDYMNQHRIDHIKYLDQKQQQLQDKFNQFEQVSHVYDTFLTKLQKNYQQIQISKIKKDIFSKNHQFTSEKFMLLTGTCENKQKRMLERLLFRKTQGHAFNMFINRQNNPSKSIFLCFINRGIYNHIGQKIKAIFILNNVTLYDLPNLQQNLNKHCLNLSKQSSQLQNLVEISSHVVTQKLREQLTSSTCSLQHELARICYLQRIIFIICHSKQIGQAPSSYIMLTIHSLSSYRFGNLSLIPTKQQYKKRTILPELPCLYQVNYLTELYSVPKFNQIMPQVFMFTTVPILFGMMFSDWGHGLMLLALVIYFKLGYIFYLMAAMSIYCGIIYNQFFGMKIIRTEQMGFLHGQWGVAENGLNFQNSLKMKISMIIAFVHMIFGLTLKILNQIKRSQKSLIIYDSIPKLGLLFTTVGYLVLLIITKWLTDFTGKQSTAPSIINSLLELYLGWNQSRKHSIFSSIQKQKQIGSFMLNMSLLFILVMVYNHTVRHSFQDLLYRFFNKLRTKRSKHEYERLEDQQFCEQVQQASQQLNQVSTSNDKIISSQQYYRQQDNHESELGPLQVFEYILGLISSTTSYLRLFALSLAHGKLSHLLLNFLLSGLSSKDPSLSILKCMIFFMVTIGMMLILDVMECMMHVVRLHWVEWMGKFYTGGGKKFRPQIQGYYQ